MQGDMIKLLFYKTHPDINLECVVEDPHHDLKKKDNYGLF